MTKYLSGLVVLTLCALTVRANALLWVDRPEARPWLLTLSTVADRVGLPMPLLAELIGAESGFQNIQSQHSSATGFGQQLHGNTIMWQRGLDSRVPEESILGAAIQFKQELDRTHTIAGAADAYGTTARMPHARRKAILARLEAAAKRFNQFTIAVE